MICSQLTLRTEDAKLALIAQPGLVFRIRSESDVADDCYLCVASLKWAILARKLSWHFALDIHATEAALVEAILTQDHSVAHDVGSWKPAIEALLLSQAQNLSFAEILVLSQHLGTLTNPRPRIGLRLWKMLLRES